MPSPDATAAHLHPIAVAALERGDASAALRAVDTASDAAALRVAGRALLALGDRAGARRAFQDALATGAHDPVGVALTHEGLAIVARTMGELDEAARHLDQALAAADAAGRAPLHREAAALAHRRGDLVNAELHARQALAAPPAAADPADLVRLGSILADRGAHAEAIEHLQHAVDALSARHGAAHFDVTAAQVELASALQGAGQLEAAEATHRSILEQRAAALGPSHPWLAVTCLALSDIDALRGDDRAARAWAEQAVTIIEGRVPSDDPQLGRAKTLASA